MDKALQQQSLFSKTDTLFFKGVGILLIVCHNFLHFIPGFGLENENVFSLKNSHRFINLMTNDLTVTNFFGAMFGFLGHYGVQIFLVFSAYGLTIQYQKTEKTLRSDMKFILHRLKKVYFLLFFGLLVATITFYIGGKDFVDRDITKMILLITTISSFSHEYIYAALSGPFWFFALIIQFYIFFPFIYKGVTFFKRKYLIVPILISLVFFGFIYFRFESFRYIIPIVNLNARFTVFGSLIAHLPELVLGITLAHYKITKFPLPIFILSIPLFFATQFFYNIFPLSFILFSIILIQIISFFNKYCPPLVRRGILYTGKISMILFILNGPLRYFDSFIRETREDYASRIFVFLLVLFLLSHSIYLIYQYLTKKLDI